MVQESLVAELANVHIIGHRQSSAETHPPAVPVALDEPEPVAPSLMRRAEVEK